MLTSLLLPTGCTCGAESEIEQSASAPIGGGCMCLDLEIKKSVVLPDSPVYSSMTETAAKSQAVGLAKPVELSDNRVRATCTEVVRH